MTSKADPDPVKIRFAFHFLRIHFHPTSQGKFSIWEGKVSKLAVILLFKNELEGRLQRNLSEAVYLAELAVLEALTFFC